MVLRVGRKETFLSRVAPRARNAPRNVSSVWSGVRPLCSCMAVDLAPGARRVPRAGQARTTCPARPRTSAAQAVGQQLLDALGVRAPAGPPHDLPDEEAQEPGPAGAVRLNFVQIGRAH